MHGSSGIPAQDKKTQKARTNNVSRGRFLWSIRANLRYCPQTAASQQNLLSRLKWCEIIQRASMRLHFNSLYLYTIPPRQRRMPINDHEQ
ncbi:hypothetical protein C6380_12035 [Pseudomonas syringae pv. actinidiae]|nr:hypothetical protein BUE60_15990 [Pseudomonas syringae pv. actinidiae]PBK57841.1 hypothetical protein BUE61_01335 [Pseudomonas syringae pv. actinidiae]RJX48508.1 hypothetical protein C6379_24625 [Pseudomonas syringae pv. actinidiae]RJX54476.1 hypothetical protein C6383_26135 [Pseudomonas syringae pv. actinidiae]RJX56740.1 hypothetical protein C6380_12035 [Pseudomonas syringae pv. actinidiae]